MVTLTTLSPSLTAAPCGAAGDRAATALSNQARREHPRRCSSCPDIVRHVVHVHHPFLREQLTYLDALLAEIGRQTGSEDVHWKRASGLFVKLRTELEQCMLHEEKSVFPQIERWERQRYQAGTREPPADLIQSIHALERWHAGLFHGLWLMLRRARDASEAPGRGAMWRDFVTELSAVCDDFDQHLFEEDCLLLPQITGWQVGHIGKRAR